jgi:DNA-binding beta-propeller fold protein YncE
MNHTIRMIVISSGTVTTLAGSALVSGSTDTKGTAARFNQPSGIAVDSSGNLYVADMMNHTIRKIDTSGNVTTIAGSALVSGSTDSIGTAARFNQPSGISTDDTYLYVTDAGNHTIRKIEIATGIVTTLAGQAGVPGAAGGTGPSATFNNPIGIAIRSTSLYVADTNNQAIRVLDTAGASVASLAGYVAGTINSPVLRPYGVTTDGINLYVADTKHYMIKEIVISSGTITTLAGGFGYADGNGLAAKFNEPWYITKDGDNLYVTDHFNHIIRKIAISTRDVTTLAGTPLVSGQTDTIGTAASFDTPSGITTDGTALYVADTGNHTIRKIDLATADVTTLAGLADAPGSADGIGGSARFQQPMGIVSAPTGSLIYVADYVNNTIRTVNKFTREVKTLAGAPGLIGSTDGIGAAARFRFPAGLATDGTYLYVADNVNSTIRKVDMATGAVTTLAGSAGVAGFNDTTGYSSRFNHPFGVVWDDTTQSLYVADTNNNSIRKIQ